MSGKNFERMRTQDPSSFAPPIAHLLGMRAVSFDEGKAVIELDAEKRHANPMGTLHGGVLCDLADLAMGAACYTTLESGESFTTLELKINYLKPERGSRRAAARLRSSNAKSRTRRARSSRSRPARA